MKIYTLILGFFILLVFTSGVAGFSLNGFLENNISDIQNNLPLSIAILIFVFFSMIFVLFFKESITYIAGIIAGLGIATYLTGFDYSLGSAVLIYSTLLKIFEEKYNKRLWFQVNKILQIIAIV